MRKRSVSARHAGLAILAGALAFTGKASAAFAFFEDFEGATHIFNAPTYNYSLNYTLPNGLTPAGGTQYMHGGAGTPDAVSTNTFAARNQYTLLTAGILGSQIDGGLVTYKLYGQFSTYHDQNDFGEVEIVFRDGANAPVGSSLKIGSSALVTALAGSPDNRAWGADQLTGTVPATARSVSVVAFETKTPGGTNIDGYMDNISLEITIVPEPGSALTAILAGSILASRRRRRDPS